MDPSPTETTFRFELTLRIAANPGGWHALLRRLGHAEPAVEFDTPLALLRYLAGFPHDDTGPGLR